MVIIKSRTRKLPDGRSWYVKLIKTKEGYYVDYNTDDGLGESRYYDSKASALRRFNKECKPLKKVIIGVWRKS
jgi:hypothetical protein